MEQKRIKVRLTENSPYSNYGYYEKGDIGYIDGYVNDNAVIILENGKFAKADLRWIEAVNEEYKNVNTGLNEDEDERIRKALKEYFINSFQNNGVAAICGVHIKDILAWLERQCEKGINGNEREIPFSEQKPVPDWMPKFLDELRSKKNYFDWDEHKDIEGGILAIINWMNPNFFNGKDGEQKPADKVEPKFKVGDTIKPKDRGHEPWQIMQVDISEKKYRFKDGYVIHFSQEDNYELVEQNPAWSEEDEYNLEILLVRLNNEEDNYPQLSCDFQEIQEIKDWLKSIKERYTWKPSEEQLIQLSNASNGLYYNCETLLSLLEQLKKLMEE